MNQRIDWENRWKNHQLGWDIGYPAPAITSHFEHIQQKHARILIPGCGNAYEAEYLFQNGWTNVFVIDISPTAIDVFRQRFPKFPSNQALVGDFFEHSARYDFVVEQTFFCALPISMRDAYARKMAEIIKFNGRLIGLVFDDASLVNGPPFGGKASSYLKYFTPYFTIGTYEPTLLSIPERMGREYFMDLIRK